MTMHTDSLISQVANMPHVQIKLKDLSKKEQANLKKIEQRERSKPVTGLRWLSKPFVALFKLRKWASDKDEDVKVRLLLAQKATGRFGGVDFHGVAIDVEYDSRKDLLTLEVHNTGSSGNHPNDHTYGKLMVPHVMHGDHDYTVLHSPVGDCGEKAYKEFQEKYGKVPKKIRKSEEKGDD